MKTVHTFDGHPAIMVKPAVLARSGVYLYSYDEMVKRGFTPPVKKDFYREYRPAGVLIRAKDKFAFSTVTVEHTDDETGPENFRDPDQRVCGIVGDSVEVTTMDDGEVAIEGNIAIYTKDGEAYYNAGNKQTSADYKSKVVLSKNPAYDLEMVDIISVNGVVLTERGRGGPNVRVKDSTGTGKSSIGGLKMKKGVLGFLGIGRTKDDDKFKLSAVVMENVKKVHTLDAAGIEKAVADVMGHITPLSESENREILIGAVTDSFRHPVEAVAKEKEVSEVIDKLYVKCRTADAEALKKTMDGLADKEETDEEKAAKAKKAADEKDTGTKDTGKLIEEAFEKFSTRVADSLPGLVDAAVAKRLGIDTKKDDKDGKKDTKTQDAFQSAVDAAVAKHLGLEPSKAKIEDNRAEGEGRSTDSVDEDASFLLTDVFGR